MGKKIILGKKSTVIEAFLHLGLVYYTGCMDNDPSCPSIQAGWIIQFIQEINL